MNFRSAAWSFYMPKWVEMLPLSHPLKTGLIEKIRELTGKIRTIRRCGGASIVLSSEYVQMMTTERIDLADGRAGAFRR